MMQNLIVEDAQHCDLELSYGVECRQPLIQGLSYQEFVQETIKIEDAKTFYNLHGDLIENLWECRGRMCDNN